MKRTLSIILSIILAATALFAAGSVFAASGEPVKTTVTLRGRSLTKGEFQFALKDSDGDTIQTESNKGDGSVTFDSIDAAGIDDGVYTYTISQIDLGDDTITYDMKDVSVTVTVKDEQVSSVSYSNTTYHNRYTAPKTTAAPTYSSSDEYGAATTSANSYKPKKHYAYNHDVDGANASKKSPATGSQSFAAIALVASAGAVIALTSLKKKTK